MKRKSLGQLAFEAYFPGDRAPKAHDDYLPVWDDVARAVMRGQRRKEARDYEKSMRTLEASLIKRGLR